MTNEYQAKKEELRKTREQIINNIELAIRNLENAQKICLESNRLEWGHYADEDIQEEIERLRNLKEQVIFLEPQI